MSLPGPPGALWTLGLLVWAGGAALLGEAIRGALARVVPTWGRAEPLERLLLDFYLGGAALYLVAALEVGAFVAPVVLALPPAGGVVVLYRVARARRQRTAEPVATSFASGLVEPWALVALVSALGLYLVEMAAATPVPTGNTYDASLLTTYVALLLQHGSVPLSFQPVGAAGLLYPQGSTVWLAWAQLDFGLPPARSSLLVTPLFLALAPLAGYVLGRRLVGRSSAGGAFALALAWLGPSTRSLVGGSNDFAFALPLVLLLGAQAVIWARRPIPSVGDAAGFGLLAGYAAAINVVGTEWLLPALLGLGALASPAFGGRPWAWLGRWGLSGAAALTAGLPSLYVLANARSHPSSLAAELTTPAGGHVGIGTAQLIGSLDPFLFRAHDIELSPIPLVRIELAVLLVLGVAALWWWGTGEGDPRGLAAFGRWALAAGVSTVGWLVVQVVAGLPGSPLHDLAYISSPAELSLSLFTVYGLAAAVPLVVALERAGPTASPAGPTHPPGRRPRARAVPALAPAVFAVVVVVPAVVLTPTALGGVLSQTYADFGNVSAADFALLAYAEAHVGVGTRVLVAPGSAAEFLPGYVRGVVVLYPMAPGWNDVNSSYTLVLEELTNGSLNASGLRALAWLDVDLIAVTGNNTVLWPALWAAPLLRAETGATPTFPVLFHDDDAWLFNATACRPGSAGCP